MQTPHQPINGVGMPVARLDDGFSSIALLDPSNNTYKHLRLVGAARYKYLTSNTPTRALAVVVGLGDQYRPRGSVVVAWRGDANAIFISTFGSVFAV